MKDTSENIEQDVARLKGQIQADKCIASIDEFKASLDELPQEERQGEVVRLMLRVQPIIDELKRKMNMDINPEQQN